MRAEQLGLDRLADILLRRLLYLVVRPRLTPADGAPALDFSRPVCYVLHDRRLSDLLVIEEETRRAGLPSALGPMAAPLAAEKRSLFFIGRARNPLASASARATHSPRLVRLVHAALNDPSVDVQLVPVTILWGRSPGTQTSLLKALFAEAWETTGALRQLVTILVHGRQVEVRLAPAVSLRELIADTTDEERALRKASRLFRVHFRRQREAAIGPDLSHRHMQIEGMLASAPLRQAIAGEAQAKGIGLEEARERARRFAWEIASDYSYPVVRAFELFLDRLCNRLYDGIDVHHFEAVGRIAPGHGIVYLPCHRSHIDYLLVSFLVSARGLVPPHIAAGVNLDLPVLGSLLRRGGAFFLRRSFKGEALYSAVFREYLHMMLTKGFPIEYFIEGGRSRSGRALPPKTGLLGMTLESFLRDHARPLALVPVYIGYEKLFEGRSFIAELEGKPKRRESLGALLGSIRDLKHDYGKVSVNFGEPLLLDRFLDGIAPQWRTVSSGEEAALAKGITTRLARELACRINSAVVTNPINLLAMALLDTPHQALDQRMLMQQIELLTKLARQVPCSAAMVVSELDPPAILAYGEKLRAAERVPHPLGEIVRVPADQVVLLTYFRNNVQHAFALPALVACLLSHSNGMSLGQLTGHAADMWPLLSAELYLSGDPQHAVERVAQIVDVLVECGVALRTGDGRIAPPDSNSSGAYRLELLSRSLLQLLERQYLIVALLSRFGSGQLSRQRLESLVQLLGQRLALLFEFATPDFSERSAFAAYIDTLIETGLVTIDAAGCLNFDERLRAPAMQVEYLLPPDALQTIRRIAEADEGREH
jgi:glycerol-3-phosphate O-acyltransferase